MSIPNPYIINIDLFWPNMSRPTQNEIARVRAFDVDGPTETEVGQSEYDPETGGWPVVLQNIAAFSATRETANLRFRIYSANGQEVGWTQTFDAIQSGSRVRIIIGQSAELVSGATWNASSHQRRVFGTVRNTLGLAASGMVIQAFHVGWTSNGIEELPIGTAESDAGGDFEILYSPPPVASASIPIGTPAGQINLIVYAHEKLDPEGTELRRLSASEVIYDAAREQRLDVVIDRVVASADSEYERLETGLKPSLGVGEPAQLSTVRTLDERPDFLTLVARSSGFDEALVRAFVRSWLIAREIDTQLPPSTLSGPMSREVIYSLVRAGLGDNLHALLDVNPDQFFQTLVAAVHRGIISAAIEDDIYPTLVGDWRTVLAKLMNFVPLAPGSKPPWQQQLLELVLGEDATMPRVHTYWNMPFPLNTTNHEVAMLLQVAAGDLLILLLATDEGSTVTTPAGWTQLWSSTDNPSTPTVRLSGYAKVCVGNEFNNPVNFQTTAPQQAVAHVYRVTKDSWKGTIAEGVHCGTAEPGFGTAANPPFLDPPGDAAKTVWLACAAFDLGWPVESYPSGYTNGIYTVSSTSAGNCGLMSAFRSSLAGSENPSSFAIDSSSDAGWVAQTVGVRGIAAADRPNRAKKEALIGAHFDNLGELSGVLSALVDDEVLTEQEAEDITFVFEMYEKVGRYYPIVATVYKYKASSNWRTIEDLATVPLDGELPNWTAFASSSTNYNDGRYPGDVPGFNGANGQGAVYARRLYDLFGKVSPQRRFVSRIQGTPTVVAVRQFLTDHPDFSLEKGDIDDYLAESELTLDSDTVGSIKQLQRVFRLTTDFDAAAHLIDQELDSAVQIARIPEDRFVADHEGHVGGLTAARDIHRTASHYANEILTTLVKFHPNLNEVGGMTAVPAPVNFSVLDPTHGYTPGLVTSPSEAISNKLPNWITLFGDLNKCACKHCQTVLSPGAYLMDLLEWVDGAPKRTLFERRPDLEDIELTCSNTNTVLPYIDLVNEVLEAVVEPLEFTIALTPATLEQAKDGDAGALSALRSAVFAEGYVLSERAVANRSAAYTDASKEWIVEDDAVRFRVQGNAAPLAVYPALQTSGTNDSLEVFPEHFNHKAYEKLAQAVFPFHLPLALGREEIDIFLKQKNIRKHEILEALSTSDADVKLRDVNIALAYLNLTPSEAQAILGAERPVPEYWGFVIPPGAEAVTIRRPDKPTLKITAQEPDPEADPETDPDTRPAWVKLVTLVPVFLHRTGLSYHELLELLDTRFVHLQAADTHGLHIVSSTEELVECNYNEFQIAHLNTDTLRRVSFFVRLWRKLGWSMRELDAYLMGLEDGEIPDDLVRLAQVKRLVDELKVPPLDVIAWWAELDTRRTGRIAKSRFDEVFLVGAPSQAEYQGLEQVRMGATVNLAAVTDDEDYPAHLRAALRLNSTDIERLWGEVIVSQSVTNLGLAELTEMYRVATFSRAMGLSVAEFYDLAALVGSPFADGATDLEADIPNTYAAIREFERARATRMSAAEIAYYLRNESAPGAPFAPTAEDIARAVQRLSAAAAEIEAAYPDQIPDAAALAAALTKMMPADKVVRAIQIVEGPPPPPNQDDFDTQVEYDDALAAYEAVHAPLRQQNQSFLIRYFGKFMSSAPGDDPFEQLVTYDAGRSRVLRYKLVWDRLRDYLVDQARTASALTVAAELMDLARDEAETLLTKALRTLTGSFGTSLDDWKNFLKGAWSTAEPGERRAFVVIPRDEEYIFTVSVGLPVEPNIEVALWVDGEQRTSYSYVDGQQNRVYLYDGRKLKAGTVLDVRITYSGTEDATLLWQVGNADPVPVPASAVVSFRTDVYSKLFKAVGLVKGLGLTRSEMKYLIEEPAGLLLDELPLREGDAEVPWSALADFVDLLDLQRSVELKTKTLFDFWSEGGGSADAGADHVAALTGWKIEDILAVFDLLSPAPPLPPPWQDDAVASNTVKLWQMLRATMQIVRRLDLNASQIIELLLSPAPAIGAAVRLRNAFRSQFSRDAWKEVFKPLRDPLRRRQRDALTGYLTTGAVEIDGAITEPKPDFFDENDLFAHFLIDVEMEPDTLISRIRLALNVVQLFVQRVFLGLENDASLIQLEQAKDQWAWMQNYRVWEANRKVFLYPENWIEPELRDDKTEFFTELENELAEGDITHERGLTALRNYLEKMSEVSNLEVVGTYAEEVFSSGVNHVLHVVGRTRFQSRSFYYRTFQAKQFHDGVWTPWKKINIDINADVVAPVVFNGRLRLFWPLVQSKQKPKPLPASKSFVDGNNAGRVQAEFQAEIRLMWSEYVASENKWLKPKLSKSRVTDNNAETIFDRELGEEQPRTTGYHLRVAVTSSEYVSVDIVKTNVPTGDGAPIPGWPSWLLDWPLPGQSFFIPTLLGTFAVWHTGEDTLGSSNLVLKLGENWPEGTVLKQNAAVEVDFIVNTKAAGDELRFLGNTPFFRRTPGAFRVFGTNFPYLGSAQHKPFFYETPSSSLFAVNKGVVTQSGLSREKTQVALFSTFNHPLVTEVRKRLHAFGPEGIMNRATQALPVADNRYYSNYYYNYYGHLYLGYHIAGDRQAWGTTQRLIESELHPTRSVAQPYPLPTIEFGYGTPFGIYNWELFFHLPMLIAGRLSQDLKFEDAMKWYHYVFDPKQELTRYEQTKRWVERLPAGCRYWNFLPFFANKEATDSLSETLGLTKTLSAYDRQELTALIDDWRHDPFNPHLIARQRLVAYQKFVVMKYLDNLIAWADQLFRLDTIEAINQATQLYILAAELLGDRPEAVEPLTGEPRYTYRELRTKGIKTFSNAIVDVEYRLVSNSEHLKRTQLAPEGSATASIKNLSLKTLFFCVPRNERIDGYWDTVQDRLFKIRNSMNIDGVKRQLKLFEPPIDPALLVRAAAAGLDLGSVLAQLNAPLPCYRFGTWIQRAVDLANELKGFGAALLAALEKKDAEDLQLVRQGHEIKMLELVRRVRQAQIAEAEENITALELSRALAEERHTEYRSRAPISKSEKTQISLTEVSTWLETGQGASHTLAGLFAPIPDPAVGMVGPFPFLGVNVKTGSALASVMRSAADALGAAASWTRGRANLAGINAGHERRWEDWKLQERLARKEIEQINQQIVAAQIRRDIAQRELENHETQMEHAEEVRDFLQEKFTSRDLYQWMVRELSRTYQQVYKLAYDVAKSAERTFQFELGLEGTSFIQFGYFDSLRQGLLAGEKLVLDLKRMEVAYLERNRREFEIQKPVSLAAVNPAALQDLREKGACEFELPEVLFDLDHPGQYFRRIRAVRLTIPCVTGPHTSVSAKLTLLGSAIRKQSTANPTAYAYTGFDDPRFVHDLVGIQSIATSSAQGDAGLFELNFRDERYLPFEGAGVISRWRLELPTAYPQFDHNTISDVVMQLSYTARDGGGTLKDGAESAILDGLNKVLKVVSDQETGLVRVLSLRKELPDVFHRLLTSPGEPVEMTLLPEHFPFVIRRARMALSLANIVNNDGYVDVHVITKPGATLSGADISLNGGAAASLNPQNGIAVQSLPKSGTALLQNWAAETWALRQSGLNADTIEDIVLVVRYTAAAAD
ncbi:neuraminidase-like domain-containing protein [Sorangium sp. So ce1097]|uniref:Tc toxin subunit A-related protein n=1 Tax=Sorangium sp. So ce1097 TaxID=3133330 RepID=UPI003F5DACF7